MLEDKGLSHKSNFKLSDEDKKKPDTIFTAFHDGLCTDISQCNACETLYNSFHQRKVEIATELDTNS